MFFVQLKLSGDKSQIQAHLEAHKQWLQAGFDKGVFLLAGNLQPGIGGGIIAHGLSRAEIEDMVASDPFVANDIVTPEIVEITPSKADPRLSFLLD